ncbi:prepilin-type N-terminal cleavage/methylation domain-containing protein [Arenicella xantha]|uniref:prepilin-type N-terminal cleavage/methylation domain-containing protein n=1 Tax=Arenicella xantha TaxID=644221 RepID=UPI0014744CBB|nr:prepilin-type N-terminal cleavage/methylation domain-containing protein [Arenicella xantha]
MPNSKQRQQGFTLIEIMVVVIVIAVISVAVVGRIGGNNDRGARLEANRFMAVVNEVRDEAVISGDNYALLVDAKAKTYSFESLRGANQGSVADSLFKLRTMRDDVKLEWDVLESLADEPELAPKVYVSSLGEITPFELRIRGDNHDYVVQIDDEGMLKVEEKATVGY